MARPKKWIAAENAAFGWGPLRQYWRDINRRERAAKAQERAAHRARDKNRSKCRCEAYPWPHRPGGGFCRHPDPPTERYQRKADGRPYGKRYAGLLRQIARANGLHPIKDRDVIAAMMPRVLAMAKQVKAQCRKMKYRNIEITETGVRGNWQSAGPMM
jgi:hypothetical protein